MLDERDTATNDESIQEVDRVQISDVLVDGLGLTYISDLGTNFWIKELLMLHLSSGHSNTLKRYRILACTRISSGYYSFISSFRLIV